MSLAYIRSTQPARRGSANGVTSSDAHPSLPWTGAWEPTLGRAYVCVLFVVSGPASAIPGTFTLELGDNRSTAIVSNALAFTDFASIHMDFNNAGYEYFRVKWEPERAMGTNSVTITTALRHDGQHES